MTDTDLQVATARMRLMESAHASDLEVLQAATGLSRGMLLHVMAATPAQDDMVGAVWELWQAWCDTIDPPNSSYVNFAVWVRQQELAK